MVLNLAEWFQSKIDVIRRILKIINPKDRKNNLSCLQNQNGLNSSYFKSYFEYKPRLVIEILRYVQNFAYPSLMGLGLDLDNTPTFHDAMYIGYLDNILASIPDQCFLYL